MSKNTRGGRRAPRPQPARDRARPAKPTSDVHVPDGVRLQKVLAGAGLGSRRACEEIILAGRVTVDGVPVTELGVRIDPDRAAVHVDGMRLQLNAARKTVAVNKPSGVVSTMHDPQGRPCLGDLLAERAGEGSGRLYHVGRLDVDSEGLILATNDGELANRLAHPSYEVPKTYVVTVDGVVPAAVGRRLRAGVDLEDGPVAVDSYKILAATQAETLIEVVLHSGRNRVVRRMFDEVGLPVRRLVRTRIGPIALGDLRPGRSRVLGHVELGTLMSQVGL